MNKEKLARKLHEWYLQAICKLKPGSYNHNAQKPFDELTEEQKFIDRYIAEEVIKYFEDE